MATHKSAKKRARQSIKRAMRNRQIKSSMKTAIRETREAVEEKDGEKALSNLKATSQRIDKACASGILHAKTASRKVSRLARLVNTIQK